MFCITAWLSIKEIFATLFPLCRFSSYLYTMKKNKKHTFEGSAIGPMLNLCKMMKSTDRDLNSKEGRQWLAGQIFRMTRETIGIGKYLGAVGYANNEPFREKVDNMIAAPRQEQRILKDILIATNKDGQIGHA